MKVELDENLGERGARLFRDAGHDVATVYDQSLSGATDREVITACQQESRCLVTLDLDFGNPLVFRPERYADIAVLRLPRKATEKDLLDCCRILLQGLARDEVSRKLWIVQPRRIREYRPADVEDDP